jgi:hypothetical protein
MRMATGSGCSHDNIVFMANWYNFQCEGPYLYSKSRIISKLASLCPCRLET